VPVAVGLAALALAALSLALALAPWELSSDAWGWLSWGRELTHGDLNTTIAISWKPLTAALAMPLSLLGTAAAPIALAILIRAFFLVGAALVYRVTEQVAGHAAAICATLAYLLLDHLVGRVLLVDVEMIVIVCALGALERHMSGRPGTAFALAICVAMARPESWPLVGLYAIWLWRSESRLRPWLAFGILLIPLLWFGGDYAGSGDAFHGSSVASASTNLGTNPIHDIRRNAGVLPKAVDALALIGLVLAWRERRHGVLAVGLLAAAWALIVVVMNAFGYPGIERFYFPPAALACVPAGYAAGRLVTLAPGRVARVAVGVLIVGLVALTARGELDHDHHDYLQAKTRSADQRNLISAIHRAGGRAALAPCASRLEVSSTLSLVAWQLGVQPNQLHYLFASSIGKPSVVVERTMHPRVPGHGVPTVVGAAGAWRVFAVTPPVTQLVPRLQCPIPA